MAWNDRNITNKLFEMGVELPISYGYIRPMSEENDLELENRGDIIWDDDSKYEKYFESEYYQTKSRSHRAFYKSITF
jgi:hypothetical protein